MTPPTDRQVAEDDDPYAGLTYQIKDCGWSEEDNAPRFEVRCVETGEVVYQTDTVWKAGVICERWNREGPP